MMAIASSLEKRSSTEEKMYVMMQGWLTRRKSLAFALKQETKYWYVLQGLQLTFHKTSNRYATENPAIVRADARGIIDLSSCEHVVSQGIADFLVVFGSEKVYHFIANSPAERDKWMQVLQEARGKTYLNRKARSEKETHGVMRVKVPTRSPSAPTQSGSQILANSAMAPDLATIFSREPSSGAMATKHTDASDQNAQSATSYDTGSNLVSDHVHPLPRSSALATSMRKSRSVQDPYRVHGESTPIMFEVATHAAADQGKPARPSAPGGMLTEDVKPSSSPSIDTAGKRSVVPATSYQATIKPASAPIITKRDENGFVVPAESNNPPKSPRLTRAAFTAELISRIDEEVAAQKSGVDKRYVARAESTRQPAVDDDIAPCAGRSVVSEPATPRRSSMSRPGGFVPSGGSTRPSRHPSRRGRADESSQQETTV